MIKVLAFLGVFAALNAAAQVPTEERVLQDRNPVGQGQQRLGFLNRSREAAQEKVKQAEQDLREARDIEGAAQKRLDAAKKTEGRGSGRAGTCEAGAGGVPQGL